MKESDEREREREREVHAESRLGSLLENGDWNWRIILNLVIRVWFSIIWTGFCPRFGLMVGLKVFDVMLSACVTRERIRFVSYALARSGSTRPVAGCTITTCHMLVAYRLPFVCSVVKLILWLNAVYKPETHSPVPQSNCVYRRLHIRKYLKFMPFLQ
jgi:hypothetical protein